MNEEKKQLQHLTEKDLKNIRWCGTPMISGEIKENCKGDLITPKEAKFWCGTVLQDKKSKKPKP